MATRQAEDGIGIELIESFPHPNVEHTPLAPEYLAVLDTIQKRILLRYE